VIVLDSGAVTALARSPRILGEYQRRLSMGEVIVVPSAVLVECRTGDARRDSAVDRLLKRVRVDEHLPNWLARTASALRTAARRGSAVDALVVAYADPGGRVVTGDLGDLRALAQYAKRVVIEGI
jgi:hypothetical protein